MPAALANGERNALSVFILQSQNFFYTAKRNSALDAVRGSALFPMRFCRGFSAQYSLTCGNAGRLYHSDFTVKSHGNLFLSKKGV